MESFLRQSQVRLWVNRHFGGHLASFQSAGYRGYHQQSDYASLDEPLGGRTHDLGYQDHDLRQERRKKVATTKSCDPPSLKLRQGEQVSEFRLGLPLKFSRLKILTGAVPMFFKYCGRHIKTQKRRAHAQSTDRRRRP